MLRPPIYSWLLFEGVGGVGEAVLYLIVERSGSTSRAAGGGARSTLARSHERELPDRPLMVHMRKRSFDCAVALALPMSRLRSG